MIRFFSNLNVARKISSGFTLIFILMVIVCIIVYFSITAITQASRWVNHTYEVIRTAESVSAAMIDMETGQRGFMIKGKEIYLEPFNSGKNNVSHLIATGRDLTSDNPSQIARWDEVKALQEKWITEVADPEIAARRIVTQGHTANKYFTEVSSRTVGKNIFDNIRELLAALVSHSLTPEFEPARSRIVVTQRLMYRALQQTLTFNAFNFYSTSDADGYLKFSTDYSPTDDWRLTGGVNVFYGDQPHTFFNQFSDASNAFIRLRLFY